MQRGWSLTPSTETAPKPHCRGVGATACTLLQPSRFLSLALEAVPSCVSPPKAILYQEGNKADFFFPPAIPIKHIWVSLVPKHHCYKVKDMEKKINYCLWQWWKGKKKKGTMRAGDRWLLSNIAPLLYVALKRKSMPLQKIAICVKYAKVI